MNEFTVTFIRQ